MKVEVELDGTLLQKREQEWTHHLAQPQENPLRTRADFAEGFMLENDLCVYTQNPKYFDGLPHSGLIVTKRPCETVFDLTPEEAAAVHALLAEVRAYLDATVRWAGTCTRRAGSTSRTFTCTSFRAGTPTLRRGPGCATSSKLPPRPPNDEVEP